MILSGATIISADGLHDDGWCWPQIRLRLRAVSEATELRVGVWLKPEDDGPSRALFTFGAEGGTPKAEFVPLNEVSELVAPVAVAADEEISLRISTSHRASRGEDARDLSFILRSLSLT